MRWQIDRYSQLVARQSARRRDVCGTHPLNKWRSSVPKALEHSEHSIGAFKKFGEAQALLDPGEPIDHIGTDGGREKNQLETDRKAEVDRSQAGNG